MKSCSIISTDELFKSAAYLTEAFTGVQLPTLASTPNPSFPTGTVLSGTATIPSTSSHSMNDPALCAPTTRSSSVLTNIVYPENEDVQLPSRSLPSTEPQEDDSLHSLPTCVPTPSKPLVAGPSAPPRLSPAEASTRMEKDCSHSADPAKPEKLLAFNLAFRTQAPLFEWLENGGEDPLGGTGEPASTRTPTRVGSMTRGDAQLAVPNNASDCVPQRSFRFGRFSKAMMATTGWEAPKAILAGRLSTHFLRDRFDS